MIKIQRAKKESRKRDEKRGRLVLSVGERKIHITFEEAVKLRHDLDRVIVAHALLRHAKELLK